MDRTRSTKTGLPKLVLMPGMDGTGELFEPFVREATGRFTCELITYPVDQIRTMDNIYQQLRTQLAAYEPFVLVAESYSAPIAIRIAANPPEGMRALVLSSPFATPPLSNPLRFLVQHSAPLFSRLPVPGLAVRLLLTGLRAPGYKVRAVRHALNMVKPNVLAQRMRELMTLNVLADLRRVTLPMLCLTPLHEALVDRHCVEQMIAANPSLQVEHVAAPHLLLQEAPKQAADEIDRFLAQL